MSASRLSWLEEQLDRDDLTDLQFDSYNREANAIQDAMNAEKNKRSLEKQKLIEEQNAVEALEKALSITDSDVDQMYEDFHKLNAGQLDELGRTFSQWLNIAKSLYIIETVGATIQVRSVAKSENGEVWTPFVSVAHARTKILSLIKIKFRDHHNRVDRDGCDFAHIPEQYAVD